MCAFQATLCGLYEYLYLDIDIRGHCVHCYLFFYFIFFVCCLFFDRLHFAYRAFSRNFHRYKRWKKQRAKRANAAAVAAEKQLHTSALHGDGGELGIAHKANGELHCPNESCATAAACRPANILADTAPNCKLLHYVSQNACTLCRPTYAE
jgi:hypothetical protein